MSKLEKKYNRLSQAFAMSTDKQEKKRIKYHLIYCAIKLGKPIIQTLNAR